ncbi:MAG: DUF3667 domain-containing protein [Saprospiraceae bacterium]
MENGQEGEQTQCLNCSAAVADVFCQSCGQRVRENSDRSIGQLLGDFLGNLFFIDNRFLLSAWYLFRFPGRMTIEFLEGKRKKFISPVTLFLFANLIYFFVDPLSDYSLSLYDQVYGQYYSEWIKPWVRIVMQNSGLESAAYNTAYQNTSDNISKVIMILNIPMIALAVYVLALKKRRYYYDSLIYAFHFFSVYITSWILLDGVDRLITFIAGYEESQVANISFYLFAFGFPLLYAVLSIKKFMDIRWYWAIPAGLVAMVSVTLANMIYRLIILVLTLWVT